MARSQGKVDENQFTNEDDFFGYLQSAEMMYGANDDELEIHPEEEAQVNISTQRSETQVGDKWRRRYRYR